MLRDHFAQLFFNGHHHRQSSHQPIIYAFCPWAEARFEFRRQIDSHHDLFYTQRQSQHVCGPNKGLDDRQKQKLRK